MRIISYRATIENVNESTWTSTHPWVVFQYTYFLGFPIKKTEVNSYRYHSAAYAGLFNSITQAEKEVTK